MAGSWRAPFPFPPYRDAGTERGEISREGTPQITIARRDGASVGARVGTAAVLAERFPGAIEEAIHRVPTGAAGWLRSAIVRAAPLLEAAHPRALAELVG